MHVSVFHTRCQCASFLPQKASDWGLFRELQLCPLKMARSVTRTGHGPRADPTAQKFIPSATNVKTTCFLQCDFIALIYSFCTVGLQSPNVSQFGTAQGERRKQAMSSDVPFDVFLTPSLAMVSRGQPHICSCITYLT